jgi:ATP-dependent DNA helicase RecG
MLLEELQRLISKGESENLEFKKTTGQRTEAAKTVCALLNGLGGFVIFGVSDKGELIGQEVSDKTLEDIALELRRIEPPAFPEIESIPARDNKRAILIRVSGERGTYTYDGRPYLRHGPTTQIMPRGEYERRLLERLHATHRWENRPVPNGITIKDLDEEEIRNTLRNAIHHGRMVETRNDDIESILTGLGLIYEGTLLNAALALYGKSERLFPLFPQFSLRLARFRGTNRLASFLDNREYWGNAFNLMRRGEIFLQDHVPIAGKVIPGKINREDYPMYPPRATREALANSICHRDFASASGSVGIAMYDDHLEIINSGAFHFNITPETLTHRHASKPWNPIIAEVFYRTGIIEKWGSGTINIIEWCKDNRNPHPKWEEETGTVIVSFFPSAIFEKDDQFLLNKTATLTDQIIQDERASEKQGLLISVQDNEPGAQVSAQDGSISAQVNPTSVQDKILEFCQKPRTAKEIMQFLKVKHRGLFYGKHLRPLILKKSLLMTLPEKPNSKNQKYYTNPTDKVIT